MLRINLTFSEALLLFPPHTHVRSCTHKHTHTNAKQIHSPWEYYWLFDMVGLLKLKTLQRKEFADFCQPEIYYSCSTIWYLMRIWQADCYFFFHMANWKMRLFDLYFNYTSSDLSPLHFLSNMNLESKHTLTFPTGPDSLMAKKIQFLFSSVMHLWSMAVQNELLFSWWRFEEGLGVKEEPAWHCRQPVSLHNWWQQSHGTLPCPWDCSSHARGIISRSRHCCHWIGCYWVLLECWKCN